MNIAMFPPNDFQYEFTRLLPHHNFTKGVCSSSTDIIYCGSISQLPGALKAKRKYKRPLVCWCWDIPFNWREWCENEAAVNANSHRDTVIAQQVHMLKQCDVVISGSKYTQQVLKSKYNVDSAQIYFYIETETLDAAPSATSENYILQVSRYAYSKKFEHTIRACARTNNTFVGVGTGKHYMNALRAQAIEANLNFTFHHGITRRALADVYKRAEIVVSPTLNEGWGMTPIEAIYCGKPILLANLDVFKELYEDDALYHKKNNVEDYAHQLERLCNDKQLQADIVNKCKRRIEDFTMSKFAKRWDELIIQ